MDLGITKEHLSKILREEKESFALYQALCSRYQIIPDQTAIAVHKAKVDLLTTLMGGEKKLNLIIQSD